MGGRDWRRWAPNRMPIPGSARASGTQRETEPLQGEGDIERAENGSRSALHGQARPDREYSSDSDTAPPSVLNAVAGPLHQVRRVLPPSEDDNMRHLHEAASSQLPQAAWTAAGIRQEEVHHVHDKPLQLSPRPSMSLQAARVWPTGSTHGRRRLPASDRGSGGSTV